MLRALKKFGIGIPPWIILASVTILVPIFLFWTVQSIHKEKEQMIRLLVEKGAALIRSFEAATRTGMMGMMGMRSGGFRLQRLLTETAQQPDIVHLVVTDTQGTILAHNDPTRIGEIYETDMDLEAVYQAERLLFRQVEKHEGEPATFEVFRRFAPASVPMRGPHGMVMMSRRHPEFQNLQELQGASRQIIFVGMDMTTLEESRREDTRHTVIMAIILLLIGFAGMATLFLAQAYRSTRSSLTRIKAFSDNVVENMPIGLVAVDGEGRIAAFNQTAESLLQNSAREVLGRMANETLPWALWALTEELHGEKRILERELDCLLEVGGTVPLDASVSILEGDNNTHWGYIILFRDLSEVRNLKREVERGQRLASLGRLAAGVAHEIRNPLSSIKGFATYFRDRYRENPEDQATAKVMIQEVDRLNRVITQLLEFARPMNVQIRPVPVHTLIQHSLKMVERQARDRDIRIETDLAPEIKEVPMDPDRFSQVLLNLYLNAIEAMEGGGALSVELGMENTGKWVRMTISDTGVGIGEKDLAHVFDPYFTTRTSGTGLGLAIVHNIIEAHGGDVRVESEVGKGTKVTIWLPMEKT